MVKRNRNFSAHMTALFEPKHYCECSINCDKITSINPQTGAYYKVFRSHNRRGTTHIVTIEQRKILSQKCSGWHQTEAAKKKISNKQLGVPESKDRIEEMRKISTGKKRDIFTRSKMRVKAVERRKQNNTYKVFIGKYEKIILDKVESENDIKILRNFEINHLGYSVDGYDKENNVVYEVDEPYHEKQIEKDVERQFAIVNHLNCDFVRLKINNKGIILHEINYKNHNINDIRSETGINESCEIGINERYEIGVEI